jgi:hypothetical protein
MRDKARNAGVSARNLLQASAEMMLGSDWKLARKDKSNRYPWNPNQRDGAAAHPKKPLAAMAVKPPKLHPGQGPSPGAKIESMASTSEARNGPNQKIAATTNL